MEMPVRFIRGRILIPLLLVLVGSLHSTGGALRIDECKDGWMEIEENRGTEVSFTCQGLSSSESVTWHLTKNSRIQGSFTCGPPDQQCNSTDPDILVSRPNATVSVLTITRDYRVGLGNTTVTCGGQNGFAQCTINVIASASVSLCSVAIHRTDWRVTGICRYEGAFASNGTYTCEWHQVRQGNGVDQEKVILGIITKTGETQNNKTYYSGSCSFTTQLSPGEGEGDYSYSVHFSPGPEERTVGTITIRSPGAPVTNCPRYVYENHVLRCDCLVNASAPGSPRPTLQWNGANTGQRLVTSIVNRNDTGHVFTCTQMWGPVSDREYLETNYTLDVAYGPDAVTVTRLDEMQTTNPNHITLQCTATGVYPAPTFSWSGVTCNSSLPSPITNYPDGSVCRFVATAEDDGKVVTCTVANSPFPAKSKNATYQVHVILPSPGTTGTAPSTEVSSRGTTGTAPSTEAAVFPTSVVIVILVVLIILAIATFTLAVILCRQRGQNRKESPKVADVDTANNEEPVLVPASLNTAAPRGPYDTLQLSDMDLRSDYSQLGAEQPQAAQGRGDYYSSLEMSNVGVRSDYSELGGQHNTA